MQTPRTPPCDGFKDVWTSGWSYCNIILYKADGIHLCFQIWKGVWARFYSSTNKEDDVIPEGKLTKLKPSLCLILNMKSHPIIFVCLNEKMPFYILESTTQPNSQSINKNFFVKDTVWWKSKMRRLGRESWLVAFFPWCLQQSSKAKAPSCHMPKSIDDHVSIFSTCLGRKSI